MKKAIEEVKQRVITKYYLTLEFLTCCYGQKTMGIDYAANRINFNEKPEEILNGMDLLIRGFYYENSLPGKKLLQTRREVLQLQERVLGNQLPLSSNPILLLHDQETVIYPDTQSVQESEDPNIRSILDKPEFSHHDALVLLCKETLLAEPYRQVLIEYNRQLSKQDPIIRALSLFIQKQENPKTTELTTPLTMSPRVIAIYQELKQIAEQSGPLTALRRIMVYPENPPVKYLQQILAEQQQSPSLAFSDKEKKIVYSLDDSHQDGITNLPGLRIITTTLTGFTQKLYKGDIDLNDTFLEAVHICGETFNQTQDNYSRLTFTPDQIKSLRTRAEQLIISAQNMLQQGISLERHLQQKVLPQTETIKAHRERNNACLTSLYHAYDALRHIVHTQKYKDSPAQRIITANIVSEPSTNIETMLATCYQTLKELAKNPARIRTEALYNTIHQISGLMKEKPVQPSPPASTTKEPEKSRFDPSKLLKT